jgi:hypothetical protein
MLSMHFSFHVFQPFSFLAFEPSSFLASQPLASCLRAVSFEL